MALIGTGAEACDIVMRCVFNDNLRTANPSRQRRDALILLMSEHPDLFDAEHPDDTILSAVRALSSVAEGVHLLRGRMESVPRPRLRLMRSLVGDSAELQTWLTSALMARAIRSPDADSDELFTAASRSVAVRASVRRACLENCAELPPGSVGEPGSIQQDSWRAAGEAITNEYHRIEPDAEVASAVGSDEIHGLELAAANHLGTGDPAERSLLTAVCRFALVARRNSRAGALRQEVKRRAMMTDDTILERGQRWVAGEQTTDSAVMAEAAFREALAELRSQGDSLSEDAAAVMELVCAVVTDESAEGASGDGSFALDEVLAWFEANYPPLAGKYGGRASLHWSLAQIIRPHHVIWPTVGGPSPRARKFVSRLKGRFARIDLDAQTDSEEMS